MCHALADRLSLNKEFSDVSLHVRFVEDEIRLRLNPLLLPTDAHNVKKNAKGKGH